MKRFVLFIGMAILCFGFNSCDVDDGVNFHFEALPIVNAEVPASFQMYGRYQIAVTYNRPDDCTFFEGFDVVKKDVTERNVVVIGSIVTDRECADLADEVLRATFNFEVLYDQTYLFRFWQGEDEDGEPKYLEIEVPVE
tara:strand:+ start:5015 stop:5431 length:417 start_codon:yes stop_codon:yes gene_type:complete